MGFKPGLTADNEPETLKAQAFSVGQSEYSGQVNDAVRSSATATEFLATDGNPVLRAGRMSLDDPLFLAGPQGRGFAVNRPEGKGLLGGGF